MSSGCKLLDVVRCSLFNATVSILDCVISNNRMERMQKEVILRYLRYYHGIWMERLRKTMKGLGQDSWCLGWDLNQRPLSLKQKNL
jgi:hypothetical protein